MPRVNLGRKGSKLVRLFKGYAGDMGMSIEDLAKPGFSVMTLRRRLENPGEFKVEELLYLAGKLHIPIEELRECIHY